MADISQPSNFDVFLCHNSVDKPAVEEIGRRLKEDGLTVWLDMWSLPVGRVWIDEIDEHILSSKAIAVFVGNDGLGPWQKSEIRWALIQAASNEMPIIPVLLPACPQDVELPVYLRERTWADFRSDPETGYQRLTAGIEGQPPSSQDRPTLLIGPVDLSARPERRDLYSYCVEKNIRVIHDLYLGDDSFDRFKADLEKADFFVQIMPNVFAPALPGGREEQFVREAVSKLGESNVLCWRNPVTQSTDAASQLPPAVSGCDVIEEEANKFYKRVVSLTRKAAGQLSPPIGLTLRLQRDNFQPRDGMHPYPGLRPFDFDDAALFFGREAHTATMLDTLREHHFLTVIGSSGCGKSSLVRAGLLPALPLNSFDDGDPDWRFVIMRPGSDPYENLARAFVAAVRDRTNRPPSVSVEEDSTIEECKRLLHRSPLSLGRLVEEFLPDDKTRILVLVDQFEEIFTYCKAGDRSVELDYAMSFVDLLLETAKQRDSRLYVTLTMRSDFIGHCDVFPDLPEAINRTQFLPPRLKRSDLQSAITKPLEFWNWEMQATVTNQLLNEVSSKMDQLPLLQHALLRMWLEARKKDVSSNEKQITTREMDQTGGLTDGLNRHGDTLYNELVNGDKDQRIAEVMFRMLAEVSSEGQFVRRAVKVTISDIAEVADVPVEEVFPVVKHFCQAGVHFLRISPPSDVSAQTAVDISHECLLRRWHKLAEWITDEMQQAEQYLELVRMVIRGSKNLDDTTLARANEWRRRVRPTEAWCKRYQSAVDHQRALYD